MLQDSREPGTETVNTPLSWGAGGIVPDVPKFKGIVLEEIVIVSETKRIKVT